MAAQLLRVLMAQDQQLEAILMDLKSPMGHPLYGWT